MLESAQGGHTCARQRMIACTIGAAIFLVSIALWVPSVLISNVSSSSADDDAHLHASLNSAQGGNELDLFQFPSVDERVRYYMGSWDAARNNSFDPQATKHLFRKKAGRSLASLCPAALLDSQSRDDAEDKNQNGLDSKGWRLVGPSTASYHCFASNGSPKRVAKPIIPYSIYCPGILSFSLLDPRASYFRGHMTQQDHLVLTASGDEAKGILLHMPMLVKARISERVRRPTGSLLQILWPYKVPRHFGPIFTHEEALRSGVPWKEKRETLFWRGGDSNRKGTFGRQTRGDVVDQWFNHEDREEIDIAFSKECMSASCGKTAHMVRSPLNIPDQMQYKYLLSLEGNDVASGLKWMLLSNSVVFMKTPTYVTWLMEDKLMPFVHYIPVQDDASDLADMVHWARGHDEECQNIARRATEYMERFVLTERADSENLEVMTMMRKMYFEQGFGDQYRDFCLDSESK